MCNSSVRTVPFAIHKAISLKLVLKTTFKPEEGYNLHLTTAINISFVNIYVLIKSFVAAISQDFGRNIQSSEYSVRRTTINFGHNFGLDWWWPIWIL